MLAGCRSGGLVEWWDVGCGEFDSVTVDGSQVFEQVLEALHGEVFGVALSGGLGFGGGGALCGRNDGLAQGTGGSGILVIEE